MYRPGWILFVYIGFYSRWMNDTFNIYKELFEACGKIDLSDKNDGEYSSMY